MELKDLFTNPMATMESRVTFAQGILFDKIILQPIGGKLWKLTKEATKSFTDSFKRGREEAKEKAEQEKQQQQNQQNQQSQQSQQS